MRSTLHPINQLTRDEARRIAARADMLWSVSRTATMTRQAILIGFTLWVLNATAPPYKRATFPDYAACVVAAQAEIDSLKPFAPGMWWECLPDSPQ